MNTFSNFGGTWPKFFVLEAVDYFTKAYCSVEDANGSSKIIFELFVRFYAHNDHRQMYLAFRKRVKRDVKDWAEDA